MTSKMIFKCKRCKAVFVDSNLGTCNKCGAVNP